MLAGCKTTAPTTTAAEQQATAPAVTVSEPVVKPALPAVAPQQLKATPGHVQDLIARVEATYAHGEANYRKGRLSEAKNDFDRAVDMMLLSGFDLRANQPLQEEFDKVIDGVNNLEMEALKQGNGFVPKEEETPAEVAGEVTFTVDPALVAKAKAVAATTKSDLPLVVNDYVAAYINFYANTKRGHNTLLHSLQRAGRYHAMIERAMAEEGVPQDLIYLAVAESSFNPRAMNPHSHAGGMWQFMPNDSFYGLKRTQWVDERFDPEKSTRAYARYMKYIYNQLGDWYLSMAAFNWGTGNVQRAVQKTGYADFWELYRRNNLPGETKNYVPQILASIIIANNLTQYGFDDLASDPPVLTDTVTINYQVDLHLVAEIVGAPMEEMVALNPSLLRSITPPDTSFDLHLPAGTATLFTQRVAAIPEAHRNSWRYHRVVAGETLASVAHQYRLSEAQLADANDLAEGASIDKLEGLAIPQASSASAVARSVTYTTRHGDTLVTIADRFGLSLDQLRSWNNLSGTQVEAGVKLHVSDPSGSSRRSRLSPAASTESASRVCTGKGKHRKCTAAPAAKNDRAEKSSASEESSTTRTCTGKGKHRKCTTEAAPKSERAEKGAKSEASAEPKSGESKSCTGKGKHRKCTAEAAPKSERAEKSAKSEARSESKTAHGAKSESAKKSHAESAEPRSRKNSHKQK